MKNKVDYDKHMLAVSYVEASLRADKETQKLLLEEVGSEAMADTITELLVISMTTFSISQGEMYDSLDEHKEMLAKNLQRMRAVFVERS